MLKSKKEEQHDFLDQIDELKQAYSYPVNTDFHVREVINSEEKKVFVFYLGSIVDGNMLAETVLAPLEESDFLFVPKEVSNREIKRVETLQEAKSGINNGYAFLLAEGESAGFLINVAKFESRSVERAQNETTIKGPKEGFTESLQSNISLIRKRMRSESLITEEVPINKNKTETAVLLYVKDIANEEVIQKVRERLSHIEADYIQSIEILEQYIEERPYSLFPSILYTERPDRAVSYLNEGHVVLLDQTSSACLILPATFWSFFHSGEDHYLRFMYGNFGRLIRIVGLFITLFASAFYVAVTTFHHEMVPTDLLLAIAAAREKVPFPVLIEVLIMEFSFELIREAGLRIPTPLGPTIGIVGALILGQAAVQANIISPIIVIIVALSGLSSFTIAEISLNYSIRLFRFIFILVTGLMGMYTLALIFIFFIFYLTSIKSFGVPFLSPLTPYYPSSKDTLFRKEIKKERWRPGFMLPKRLRKNE